MQIRLQPFTSTNIPYGDNITADNDNNEKVLFQYINTNDQTANRMLVIRAIHETDKISQKQQTELREFNAIRMYEALDVVRTSSEQST
jgi:hypothetical protein